MPAFSCKLLSALQCVKTSRSDGFHHQTCAIAASSPGLFLRSSFAHDLKNYKKYKRY